MANELEHRLLHYKDVGPGLDWPQFLDDTEELSESKLLSAPDIFRLQLMRLALFRQQKMYAEGYALAEQLEEQRHRAYSNDIVVLDGESVLLYLHGGHDDKMTEAALKLMHPNSELEGWTASYMHYVLAQMLTILGSDSDADREFALSALPHGSEYEQPFSFVYNQCIYKLLQCWMSVLRFPDRLPQILEDCHALMRESQQYWPSYSISQQSQSMYLIFQVFMGIPLSKNRMEDIWDEIDESETALLKASLSFSKASKLQKQGDFDEANKELLRIVKLFKDNYHIIDKRSLNYYLESMLLLVKNQAQSQQNSCETTLIEILSLQNDTLRWMKRRSANGFTVLMRQSQELASIQREKGNLLASLESQRYELERAHRDLIARLAHVAEYRDDQTGGHAARVGRMTARLAKHLGYSSRHARDMGYAARLHDLGKVSLPDDILLKPGLLTAQEREEMQRHTKIGAQILSGAKGALQTAHDIALYHHERWDGEGYPFGLKGEKIPLPARIVAVADVLDAMLTARPYRQPMGREDALAEVQAMSGSHFDPKVVEALERVMVEMEQNLRW